MNFKDTKKWWHTKHQRGTIKIQTNSVRAMNLRSKFYGKVTNSFIDIHIFFWTKLSNRWTEKLPLLG